MKIIIAGGGPGGLAAATALAQTGHQVEVLERVQQPMKIGAGISLQPNAMQALACLGLDEEIQQRGCRSIKGRLLNFRGKSIQEFDFAPYEKQFGHYPYTIHRPDLYDILLRSARQAGASIYYGQNATSYEINGQQIRVITDLQKSFTGDCLVGADGIHSRVRAQLWGDQPTRYSGYVCWRGIVDDPETIARVSAMCEIWGHGSRFGYMRCSSDKVYWFATMTTRQSGSPNPSWKKHFFPWPDPVRQLLENTHEEQINYNEIHDRKPISRWGDGPVTLLGDAAHPMTPNFGQGGAQAIEDAIVLARVLSITNPETPSGIESALRTYESHRSPRTNAFVKESRQFGRLAQAGNWFWRFMRNRILPFVPQSSLQKSLEKQFRFQAHIDSVSRNGSAI